MDFELNEDQQAIVFSVEGLLKQYAGAERAVALGVSADYDEPLETALREAGFVDLLAGPETGALEAALAVEAVARFGGVVSAGASLLVAPGVAGQALPGPVAVCADGATGPVRFAAHARTLLLDAGDEVRVVDLEPGDVEVVPSNFGYPMGRLRLAADRARRSLGPGSGERLRSWWRAAIAVEAVGTMAAALDTTVEYVKRRRQFGRAIGSFQAVQHRLAECAVLVHGSRWLAYEAAWKGAPAEDAAVAAAHATAAASRVFNETHQLSGAMGFTREHELHVFSMRLQALRLEGDGAAGQQRAVARARWVSAN